MVKIERAPVRELGQPNGTAAGQGRRLTFPGGLIYEVPPSRVADFEAAVEMASKAGIGST